MKYVIGDATQPEGDGTKIIAHICNDIGLWGAGFVMAISNRWLKPEQEYKAWAKGNGTQFKLGETQIVKIETDLYVANMIAQRGIRNDLNLVPLDLDALSDCLWELAHFVSELEYKGIKTSVHMPRIGCGLAGGNWSDVAKCIDRFSISDITTVYDLE